MDERRSGYPAVFVVTIRSVEAATEQLQGSVVPIMASGYGEHPKRWFRALDQLPGIFRTFLAALRDGER